ncbi:MAG TPA: 2,3-diaminopropionate biosynthesis protein SbnA [Thermoanaerobaculia bacterium]
MGDQVHNGILSTVGDTPLVRLGHLLPSARFQVYAKLESFNPGGSIKDRPALQILEEALRSAKIRPGSVVVESSSGNMGIGLAQACRYHNLRFICVVDPKTSAQNLRVLRAYGAEVDLVSEPDPVSGEFLQARITRVKSLLQEIDGAFWPNQYANQQNPGAHYHRTMREVATALAGKVDVLFVATSTCGTIRGCGEYVRDHGLSTRVIAVDALGSLIFSHQRAKRMIPGLGAGLRPPLCDPTLIDDVVLVNDLECVEACRRLVARESILAGGSSGAVVAALERLQETISDDANCVLILPDRGERYLDTIYDDDWVREHLGGVAGSPLCQDTRDTEQEIK